MDTKDTRDRGIRRGTVTAAPVAVGRRGRRTDADPGAERRAGGTDGAGALRIAELEREIQELQRANETLKQYVSKALDLGTVPTRRRDDPAQPPGGPGGSPMPGPAPGPVPGPAVEFRVLGPVEAAVGGRWVDLGAPKQRAALVLLVSQAGQPVSVDALVETLWEGRPPQSAITSLHAYIANLRRVLEPHRAPRTPATVLCTRGRGYLLNSRAVEVDAHRFWKSATAGWQALDRGDPQRALHAFQAGLDLWRGEAYAEAATTPHVLPEAVRLEELRLSVIESRCATLIAVGNHEMAVPELVAFTQAHPLREYGCELLSLALYRAGRQADALSVLRVHQKRMVEDLGISPSPALRHLETEILRQAPELDGSQRVPGGGSAGED
ncbi:AfsR/SARP family transcriptional regulator [Streptomyces mobaraensis NBRC 13819 = DSM 40847]|uniref:Winged helix family transcriptional regulator n=1 Tax=Streptomyces mobaraensis (strain ATCC 29032 / DSM 40847 / JCM 4168 / NBRC 13819 / NCIMB 11159 / IPCR 16-22) TaxID=1223523 RepID=M3AAF4_STRM1|nr:AfsR/SARP family transcriptional regulator [Streptomyces mobaraensis]EMF02169.1 winged helix family transcriptional regulator [Streptomyces mobaraensis NBRC 13819 = DSM 40847]QTT76654.1 AfsR/SARP family transcriptional regulator [Streptomyces mobaraensis NBRC 13819 = DSM 40847]